MLDEVGSHGLEKTNFNGLDKKPRTQNGLDKKSHELALDPKVYYYAWVRDTESAITRPSHTVVIFDNLAGIALDPTSFPSYTQSFQQSD